MQQRIDFQIEEPGEDPWSDLYFQIMAEAIQPDAVTTLDEAVKQLLDLLPEGTTSDGKEYNEVGNLLSTGLYVAEQVPYNHNAQSKLITLLDSFLKSSEVMPYRKDPVDDRIWRYQHFKENVVDWWNSSRPKYGTSMYINSQAFAARLCERGMLHGSSWAVYTFRDTFKDAEKTKPDELEAYVMAASNWILLLGHQVYVEAVEGDEEGYRTATLKQLREWRGELEAATSEKPAKRYAGFSDEGNDLAERAAEEMRALEHKYREPSEKFKHREPSEKRGWSLLSCFK